MLKPSFYILFFSLILFSCQEKKTECKECDEELKASTKTKEASIMYEPSELATLMLDMYEANQDWKAEILKGNVPKDFPEKYKQMHGAKSVNENAGGEFYNATTTVYLKTIEDLTLATPENAKEKFNAMVNVCLQCHQEICPGPIPKIKKLIIE